MTSPKVLPFHKTIPRLVKDPVTELARMGAEAGGRIVRLNLGPFRPYLVSHPDHVQQVLKTEWSNFLREGMFWRPVRRLTGQGILREGEDWASTRKILQPLFTARYMASLAEDMADAIAERILELDDHARAGRPIDGAGQMTAIVNQAVVKVLFGGRISRDTAERLAPEFATCATTIGFRLLFPFVPYSVKVPGDRAFLRAMKNIDEIVYPLIEQARREGAGIGKMDLISAVLTSRTGQDGKGDLRQVRDDLVSMYATSTETTAMSLTWLWAVLHEYPAVSARLHEEIDRVVGDGPVRPEHATRLPYLHMVLQELLRLYPAGWIIPRQAVADTEIGGVRIKSGSQVLISPYTTHRLPEFWDRPLEFDPDRWAGESTRRHRYAYFPFGAGPHSCLGQNLFNVEAPLVVAGLLSRYRLVLTNPQRLIPVPGASARPKQQLLLRLMPIERNRPT
ncbi:cytochrome P450 [Nonomuraea basaltis]|uniref:cytochrome P450 n=1 Tax=Nonomuraea basaltis TaxID=2495887 RepID=UPI00197EFFD0|nr:cytochrome P450 [Nonomuraea basaltis]